MPKLVYKPGHLDERAFEIGAASVVIGRVDECEICIVHKSLSRRHARVELVDGHYVIVDLGSKNGVFVGGARVERRILQPGDTFKLGDLTFALVMDSGVMPAYLRSAAASSAGDPAPHHTLAVNFTRVPIEQLLAEVGGSGALRVKEADIARRAQDKLQILLKVSQLLSSTQTVDALLHQILELVFQILDVDRAAVLLADPETGRLEPRVMKTRAGGGAGQSIYSRNIVDYVQRTNLAALFSDAAADPRLDAARSIIHQSIRASMCVPLMPRDEVIGVLYVDNLSSPRRFSEEDLEFLAAFASQAAVSIENNALYRRIEAETMSRMQLIMDAKLASLGAVVAGIAHEIKNPLNFINNFAELSRGLADEVSSELGGRGRALDPEVREDLLGALAELSGNVGRIEEHGRRANAIIDGMLLHARGRSEQASREALDLESLVSESVKLGCRSAPLTGEGPALAVDEAHDPALGKVEAVSADLSRVLINVVQNACHAMQEKRDKLGAAYAPELQVRSVAHDDRVEVKIRDNGVGVAEAIADKIYNPFFTTRAPGEGIGLGLSISWDIVVQGHQGKMAMESVPGEFAEMAITLPRRAPARESKSG